MNRSIVLAAMLLATGCGEPSDRLTDDEASIEQSPAILDDSNAASEVIEAESELGVLKRLVENHARLTGSARAQLILDNWEVARTHFVKVFPNEYRRALGELAEKSRRLAA